MGRYYSVSKVMSDEQAETVMAAFNALEKVEKAELVDEGKGLIVYAAEEDYLEVMTFAVNLFAREGSGAALSFQRFIAE